MESRLDKQQARNFIEETFEQSFNKTRFTAFIKNLLNRIEETPFTYQGQFIPDAYKPYISVLERIGKYSDGEHKIDILIIRLKKETSLERARTMQRNFVAWYLNGSRGGELKDAALVAFTAPDETDWRFSLVKMDYKFEQTPTGKIKVKEEFTPARRWSFLVGVNEKSHTAQSRLVNILANDEHAPTLAELEDAFNIETVTKEFFLKYRDLFIRTKEALDEVVKNDARIKADFEAKGVNTVDFAKKLLGQIVFLYFLQKKGWFGAGRDADWGTGSKQFLRELFEKKHGSYNNFFNDILEPLFYEALRNDRSHDDDYYSRFNCKIPFLNGGLFDPIGDYDWVHTDIILPDSLFSNENKTKESDIGDGILDIFDRYNFTVRENEPLEKEVAVDPEMLGKVFENLLEVKDRKSKGTYYTPREIVHYMCQESLINYLDTALNVQGESIIKPEPVQQKLLGKPDPEQLGLTMSDYKPTVPKEDIEEFIRKGEAAIQHDMRVARKGEETETYKYKLPESIRSNAEHIDNALATIKICDPAIGSGAFPVGMMQEIVKARETLTTYIGGRGDSRIAPTKDPERTPYDFKRHCIQESIYGVGIDSSAVDIAKLRLWLSLIVDEEDYKRIKPLPNLEYKIACGNSLLGVEKDLFNEQLFRQLEALKPQYFEETNPRKKNELKRKIDSLIKQITNNDEKFDFEVYFSEAFHEKGGFDVVIANPPYVRQEQIKPLKPLLQKRGYLVYNPTSDLYTYFLEKSYNILKPFGISTFITSNKWMRAEYGEKLRKFFKKQTNIDRIIDFGGYKVFDATVDTNITIFQKPNGKNDTNQIISFTLIKEDYRANESIEDYIKAHVLKLPQQLLDDKHFTFAANAVLRLKEKIEKTGTPLSNWNVNIYRGIVTGLNEVFAIDTPTKEYICAEDPKSAEIIKPLLRGRDIHKYCYKWNDLWIIALPAGWTNKHKGKEKAEEYFKKVYTEVYNYLKGMADKIENGEIKVKGKGLYNRDDQGDYWWELRPCDYYQEFEKEKIVYPDISEKLTFSLDNTKKYLSNTGYFIRANETRYLLGVLNSNLLDWYYRYITSQLGAKGIRHFTIYIEQLPIPKISVQEQQPFITLVDQILSITKDDDYLRNSQKRAKVKEYERQIDQMVYELYGLTPDEIAIVEGRL